MRHTPYNLERFEEDDYELLSFVHKIIWWVPSVKDINHFKIAMTHSSLQKVAGASNERLEFLGDSVFGLIITEYLFTRFKTANEGVLTRLRTKLVNGHALADIARKIGIENVLAVSKRITNYNKRMLEDAFESLIGAIYIDQGIECCKKFIVGVVDNYLEENGDLTLDNNYKDILLKQVQNLKIGELTYVTVDTIGPPHQRLYRMQVVINDRTYGVGCASSKKEAEQHAARETLVILGNAMENNIC